MINSLLSSQVQTFIEEHSQDDPTQLLLKYKAVGNVPISLVVDQIIGRKKAIQKLPTWLQHKSIIYPPAVNIEQSSSEKTAITKVDLVTAHQGPDLSGKKMLDLTGGLGVDSFFFSRVFSEVHFVEPNVKLLEIAKHNHHQLGANNILHYGTKAEDFLTSSPVKKNYDLIYIDPARRSKGNQKVFSFNQCEPNVIKIQEEMWQTGKTLLVKSSPLLDVSLGIKDLQFVKEVCITSVHNDCKELLFYCENNFRSEPVINAINLNDKKHHFSFMISDERKSEINYSDPLKYLYEPNASLLKSGAFKTIASVFNVYKIHPNTHLYTSDDFIADFPGRIFYIEAFLKSDVKMMKNVFDSGKANIFVRNYPLSVKEIRKKTGLKEGGDKFLIGCSGLKKKFLLAGARLDSL